MPKNEIKNTFTGGRMNKDLDERLITTGEYRDAMNVQVTTSEGSDVGSLHNILGNDKIGDITGSSGLGSIVRKATCVGSVADEKNDKLYWLIEGLSATSSSLDEEYYKADAIAEYDKLTNSIKPVVTDVYEVNVRINTAVNGHVAWTDAVGNPTVNQITISSGSLHYDGQTTMRKRIWKGMICTITDNSGGVLDEIEVIDFNDNTGEVYFLRDVVDPLIATAPTSHNFNFKSPQRALNFAINNVSGLPVDHYLVTGINIIDKQLFWTDNNSEPKRVHIDRYRDFGTWTFDEHTWTPERDFSTAALAYVNNFPLVESHITVIRQKPLLAPQLIMDNSAQEGLTEGSVVNETDDTGNPINSIPTYEVDDDAWIDFDLPAPDFKVGNIIVLTTTTGTTVKTIRAIINDPDNPGGGVWPNAPSWACASGNPCTAFKIVILSADPGINISDIDWHAELEETPPMFEFKFPRFSTRYKYEDGEYSAFGLWSEVAFLPDRPSGKDFDFLPSKGYNTGMTNQIRRLALYNFVGERKLLPVGVVGIDILYKESNSPNVYSLLTVQPDENAWNHQVAYTGGAGSGGLIGDNVLALTSLSFPGQKGYLKIESEIIHGILPENQLLRSYDNVPRKALAQEVSGNRLIYGNYLQNYDLLDIGNNIITPKLNLRLSTNTQFSVDDLSPEQVFPQEAYKYSPSKSIKSLRTYQLGVVYIDKYGRETPVFTDNNDKKASMYLNEWYSDRQVQIKASVSGGAPDWAEYYKYFIKETSSEYYNLALDRWYDADDDNVWLSFPSSERNKVDIDTYLILKKEHDGDNPVQSTSRYDVLAIENEAPEFVKTEDIPIGSAKDDLTKNPTAASQPSQGATGWTFGPNGGVGFPTLNGTSFTIHNGLFDGNIVFNQTSGETRKGVFVRFKEGSIYSKWYEVTRAFEDTTVTPGQIVWLIDIIEPFGEDINILTTNPGDAFNYKKPLLEAEFTQRTVRNKPEFDGRFFVKIYNDGIIKESVAIQAGVATEYQQVFARQVQYINQKWEDTSGAATDIEYVGPWDAWGVNSITTTFFGNNVFSVQDGGIPSINFYGDKTVSEGVHNGSITTGGSLGVKFVYNNPRIWAGDGKNYWKNYNDQPSSGWFIDENPSYRYWLWLDHKKDVLSPSAKIFGSSSPYVDEVWGHMMMVANEWNASSKDKNGNPTGFTGYHHKDSTSGINKSPGDESPYYYRYKSPYYQGGIGLDAELSSGFFDGNTKLHLSYSGLSGEDLNSSLSGTNMTPNLVDFGNDFVSEIAFIEALTTAGTLWTWAEDPDQIIYRTSLTTFNGDAFFNTTSRFDGLNISGNQIIGTGGRPWGPLITFWANHSWNRRDRYTIHAGTFLGTGTVGDPMGSGPSKYLPTNDPGNHAHFANDGSLLDNAAGCSPCKPSTDAPGIRQDGMGAGSTVSPTSGGYTITATNKKLSSGTGATDNQNLGDNTIPGSVTWQILKPVVSGRGLKHSSRNPAIFETEPKENLDLEIYHEIGQTYPTEYNEKTNELYIPIGSIVTCWRPNTTTYDINDFGQPVITANQSTWDNSTGLYQVSTPTAGTGTDDIPNGNITLGGSNWVPPIIVSAVGEDTITLTDDTGVAFNGNTGWPNEHILIGDWLGFIRPDGSKTTAKVTGRDSINNNVYHIRQNVFGASQTLPWFNSYTFGNGVESNRIRDDYNQVFIDKGPKVSSVLDEPYKEERKLNGLIYSGIYNSTSGVNNLNEFIAAEKITKDLNPTFGSIQKLFQRRINLVAFCEDRVIKILSNKDALYNSDGSANLTATSRVLGDAQPFTGGFGISKNPESFASDSYRAYFTDKQRSAVLRLSRDGITAISDHGMVDWFRDNMMATGGVTDITNRLVGSFDVREREYNLTLTDYTFGILSTFSSVKPGWTISFREDIKGWVSFKSYIPENGISLAGSYYTFKTGNIWEHHHLASGGNFNKFYNIHTPSHVTTVFNTDPKSIKNFETLNYEGTQTKVNKLVEYINYRDGLLYTDSDYHNLEPNKLGWYVSDIHTDMQDGVLEEFIEKEGKWFNYIKGKEIVASASGLIGGAGLDYDPNEFSWQGIGLGGVSYSKLIGGCTDPNAANYGCATLLYSINPQPSPCIGSSPDCNGVNGCPSGVCADGTSCNIPNCCGPGNGWDWIDYDDSDCDITGVVYGCKSAPSSPNYDCETSKYPSTGANDFTYTNIWDGQTYTTGNPCAAPYNACPCADGVTHDDGSCIGIPGCTWVDHPWDYNANATQDCTGAWIAPYDPNYTPGINWDDCCEELIYGCTDATPNGQFNYDPNANMPCDNSNPGCFTTASNNVPYGSLPPCSGNINWVTNGGAMNGGCCEPYIYGCMDSTALNYYSAANTPTGDPTQSNPTCCHGQTFGSHPLGCDCIAPLSGCMDNAVVPFAYSPGGHPDVNGYGSNAIYDTSCTNTTPNTPTNAASISQCTYANQDCGDGTSWGGYMADNYDPMATVSTTCNGNSGCTDPAADNYDPYAYVDDGSCIYLGCCGGTVSLIDHSQANGYPLVNNRSLGWVFELDLDGTSCPQFNGTGSLSLFLEIKEPGGATVAQAFGNNTPAENDSVWIDQSIMVNNVGDQTSIPPDEPTFTSPPAVTSQSPPFNPTTHIIDPTEGLGGLSSSSWFPGWNGTWEISVLYKDNNDNSLDCFGSYTVEVVKGCMDPTSCNYDPLATFSPDPNDPTACYGTRGCMDSNACGYDPSATCDCDGNSPGSGAYIAGGTYGVNTCCDYNGGCMDSSACNYDANATCDDGSCLYGSSGCTNSLACNYDQNAVCDDGSCITGTTGCMGLSPLPSPSLPYWNASTTPAIPGACNYDANATCDDGSCTYCNNNATVSVKDPNDMAVSITQNVFTNYDANATCDTYCEVCPSIVPPGHYGSNYSPFTAFATIYDSNDPTAPCYQSGSNACSGFVRLRWEVPEHETYPACPTCPVATPVSWQINLVSFPAMTSQIITVPNNISGTPVHATGAFTHDLTGLTVGQSYSMTVTTICANGSAAETPMLGHININWPSTYYGGVPSVWNGAQGSNSLTIV